MYLSLKCSLRSDFLPNVTGQDFSPKRDWTMVPVQWFLYKIFVQKETRLDRFQNLGLKNAMLLKNTYASRFCKNL